ncbi:MAG: hypothetical protein HY399_01910 [Elusimicrobia bacterium]|nr:hypothetical protein [Elusimicrobiota bacterium]
MPEKTSQPLSRKLLVLLLSASLTPLSSKVLTAQVRTTVAKIMSSPSEYNQQTVSVTGKIQRLKHATSKNGKEYTTFTLSDSGRYIHVFSWGKLGLSNGQAVTVTGVFYETKQVNQYTFKNEIEAQLVQ